MPFKFHASRRHHIPRAKYRVMNWPDYDRGVNRAGFGGGSVLQKNRKVQKPLIESDNFFILVGSSLQSPCIEAVIAKNSLFPPNSPLHRARGDRTPGTPAMARKGSRVQELRIAIECETGPVFRDLAAPGDEEIAAPGWLAVRGVSSEPVSAIGGQIPGSSGNLQGKQPVSARSRQTTPCNLLMQRRKLVKFPARWSTEFYRRRREFAGDFGTATDVASWHRFSSSHALTAEPIERPVSTAVQFGRDLGQCGSRVSRGGRPMRRNSVRSRTASSSKAAGSGQAARPASRARSR